MRSSIFFVLFFVFIGGHGFSQETYMVNGESLQLEKEVDGPLTLLVNKESKKTRFFSQKEGVVIELTNTIDAGVADEAYKEVLKSQTDNRISTDRVNFNLRSLSAFFSAYNQEVNGGSRSKVQFLLGAVVGVDNVIYISNPENALHPMAGIEFEVKETSIPHSSFVFRANSTFKTSDHDYNGIQLSLNYRFKFITTPRFDAFVNAKLATFYSETLRYTVDGQDYSRSGSNLNAPFLLGIGADYRLGNGYITFGYNDIVGLNIKSNKKFPVNFSLGYKFLL